MTDNDKYLNMTDEQLDNLLMGVDLDLKSNNKQTDVCINCKSSNLVIDSIKGYFVCSDCAVVNDEIINENNDNSNDPEERSARYGGPTNYFCPKSSLGSKIVTKSYNNRLAMIQKQGQMPYKEKSLMEVLERIQSRCKKYNITQSIIDSAKILYKMVSDSVHSKGKRKGKSIIMRCINRRSMIAACLFYACKLQKEPRSPKEVADIYDLEIKHVNRGCRKFNDIIDFNSLFSQVKSSQSSDFIERFSKKLNIDKEYIQKAKDVSNNIHKLNIASNHEPPSVAAGCILLVSSAYNLDLNKKQISDIFGISDVTISKTYRKINPYHNIILSNNVTDLIIEGLKNRKIVNIDIDEENLVVNKNNKLLLTDSAEDSGDNNELGNDSDSEFESEQQEVAI